MRETGDYSILEEAPSYAYTDGQKTDTIYDHVIEGLEFFLAQFSDRGLPLILKGDWDDALDQMGKQHRGDSARLACRAIFGHRSCWLIWAECYGGRRDKAYETLHKIMPATRHAAAPEIYRVEPYVACQFIYDLESDRPRRGLSLLGHRDHRLDADCRVGVDARRAAGVGRVAGRSPFCWLLRGFVILWVGGNGGHHVGAWIVVRL